MPTLDSDKSTQKKIHSKVELYLIYPISPLLALRRSLSWVLTFFLILGTVFIATYAYKKSGLELNEASLKGSIHSFLIFALIVIVAKIIFEYLQGRIIVPQESSSALINYMQSYTTEQFRTWQLTP
jgi:hypothetical protein